MTREQLIDLIKSTAEQGNATTVVGIRFENRLYAVGDTCDNSRANDDREDEREFPAYGTAEYNQLPELDGTCAWGVGDYWTEFYDNYTANIAVDDALSDLHIPGHAYLVASDEQGDTTSYAPDDGEVLLRNCKVVAVIY